MDIGIKKLHNNARIPTYATDGSAGFDFYAIEPGIVFPGEMLRFSTGLAFEIPDGYVLHMYSRSGHGFNSSIRLCNCVGVIDSDYIGEVSVGLYNDGATPFYVKEGDRIAQGVIQRYEKVTFNQVSKIRDTTRGIGGYGSTGR